MRQVRRVRQHHIINWSGGIGSWYTARLVRHRYPDDPMTLLFADTLIEADDLYLFSEMAATQLGLDITVLRDGRDIWDVFEDVRYLGNTRIDPCSYHLKRKLIREWIEEHCDVRATTCYLGIDWSESHRMDKARVYWEPWRVRAPLCLPPYVDKAAMIEVAEQDGLAVPSLYRDGFPHNNCGGGCVKAGMGQFKMLLEKRPATYAKWEEGELRIRRHLRKNVTILRDRSRKNILERLGLTDASVALVPVLGRRGNVIRHEEQIIATGKPLPKLLPITLREFRQRLEGGTIEVDEFDLGGCGCAVGDVNEDARVLALGMPKLRGGC